MDSEEALHDASVEPISVGPIDERGSDGGEASDLIGAAQQSFPEFNSVCLCLDSTGSHDETWDIDQELVRGSIRAFDEAEFAVVAEVNKLSDLFRVELVRIVVYFVCVEMNKEFWKCRTEIEAKAAGVTDVVLSSQFLI